MVDSGVVETVLVAVVLSDDVMVVLCDELGVVVGVDVADELLVLVGVEVSDVVADVLRVEERLDDKVLEAEVLAEVVTVLVAVLVAVVTNKIVHITSKSWPQPTSRSTRVTRTESSSTLISNRSPKS